MYIVQLTNGPRQSQISTIIANACTRNLQFKLRIPIRPVCRHSGHGLWPPSPLLYVYMYNVYHSDIRSFVYVQAALAGRCYAFAVTRSVFCFDRIGIRLI